MPKLRRIAVHVEEPQPGRWASVRIATDGESAGS
jgi:hypothetical protein